MSYQREIGEALSANPFLDIKSIIDRCTVEVVHNIISTNPNRQTNGHNQMPPCFTIDKDDKDLKRRVSAASNPDWGIYEGKANEARG